MNPDLLAAITAAATVFSAIAALLTALGTFLLAFFAYRAWSVASATLEAARLSAVAGREAADQSRLTVLQMRADSDAMREDSARRSRPYVCAEAVPGLWGVGHWDLVIQNQGKSVARDVRLIIDQDIPVDDIGRELQSAVGRAYTLTPSARHRFAWRTVLEGNEAGMPGEVALRVEYLDDQGRPFRDDFQVDTTNGNAYPAPQVGEVVLGNEPENVLKNIRFAIEALNTHVGELRR